MESLDKVYEHAHLSNTYSLLPYNGSSYNDQGTTYSWLLYNQIYEDIIKDYYSDLKNIIRL